MKKTVAALISLIFLAGCGGKAMRASVLEVIRDNPDAVIEALSTREAALYELVVKGQRAYAAIQEKKRLEAQLAEPLAPALDPGRPALGKADAPSLVVVYSDFQCPYCAQGAKTLRAFEKAHQGDVRVVFKHMPGHKLSLPAAVYFEAIGMQDPQKAFAFHDRLFERQDEMDSKGEALFKEIARQTGCDMNRLSKDMKDKAIIARIEADLAEAQRFGITGTPTFVINGVVVPGAVPLEDLDKVYALTRKNADQKSAASGKDASNN